MDIFTLKADEAYRKHKLIENFESLIWTERYSSPGDITLECGVTQEVFQDLAPGTLIGTDVSNVVMRIDAIQRKEDEDGRETLKVTGRSLDWILNNRVAKKTLTAVPWDLSGRPGAIMCQMVSEICISGLGVSSSDVIPNLIVQNNDGLVTSVDYQAKDGTLYERLKELADAYNLGHRLYRNSNPTTNYFTYEVYTGEDRTVTNLALNKVAVVFSKENNSMSQIEYLNSIEDWKTVAYVYSENGSRIVDATLPIGFSNSGLNRNVLLVDATDIQLPAGADLQANLLERGRTELSNHLRSVLYDGQANPNSEYEYGLHYKLGDIVLVKSAYAAAGPMRVTEHIRSVDQNGLTSYPTFSDVGGV